MCFRYGCFMVQVFDFLVDLLPRYLCFIKSGVLSPLRYYWWIFYFLFMLAFLHIFWAFLLVRRFLSVFFCNSISDSREALLLVFSQPLLSPLPLPQSTGVKDRPFPDWYLPIKWGPLASMAFCTLAGQEESGRHSYPLLLVSESRWLQNRKSHGNIKVPLRC